MGGVRILVPALDGIMLSNRNDAGQAHVHQTQTCTDGITLSVTSEKGTSVPRGRGDQWLWDPGWGRVACQGQRRELAGRRKHP